MIDIRHGDCISEMQAMDDACVDSVVTDPPYELGFMGKGWDSTGIANSVEMWREAFRVLKPGGHMLAFSSTRTYHRMVCAIEDAGFEIRDQIGWLYGSGFPKSMDVSKAIDKAAGAEREVIGEKVTGRANAPRNEGRNHVDCGGGQMMVSVTAPATAQAQQWAGFGTSLKPAWEPICVARKPLSEKTVAANVLKYGCGAINIDACRIECGAHEDLNGGRHRGDTKGTDGNAYGAGINRKSAEPYKQPAGRWPANCIHDGSDEVLEAFAAFGTKTSGKPGVMRKGTNDGACYGTESREPGTPMTGFGDSGSAARFFYSAKASAKDRAGSKHPTIKPVSLMRYLCKLVTPPGGTVLDPFAGSGTTLQAALEEGFHAIGIEQSDEYVNDIRNRIGAAREGLGLFAVAAE